MPLSTAELASVQNVVWAAYGLKAGSAGSLHDAVAAVLGPVTRSYTGLGTRNALEECWNLVVRGQSELSRALLDLCGAPATPAGQPRDFYVSRAKSQIDYTQANTLPAILAACDQCKALGAGGTYPATMD